MGLRRPQGDEIYKIFGPELKEFLTNQPLIKSVTPISKNLTQDQQKTTSVKPVPLE